MPSFCPHCQIQKCGRFSLILPTVGEKSQYDGYNGERPTMKLSAAETERKAVLVSPIGRSEPDELGCSTVGRKVAGSSSKSQKFRKIVPQKKWYPPLGRGGGLGVGHRQSLGVGHRQRMYRPQRCTDHSDVPLQRCLGRPLCGPPW